VRVDKPWHHCHARQIDNLGAGGNRHVRPDIADPVAFDEDDLVGEDATAVGIEQPAGADHGRCGRRRLLRGKHRREQQDECRAESSGRESLQHGGEATRRRADLQASYLPVLPLSEPL